MGGAIVRGLAASTGITPADIALSSPRQNTVDALAEECPGISTFTDNKAAIKDAEVIILAVKPWVLPSVLDEIAPYIAFRSQSIVSLAAGISLDDMSDMLRRYSTDRSLFRVIPNTAMSVGESMTFVCHNDAGAECVDKVVGIFDRLGATAVIEIGRAHV